MRDKSRARHRMIVACDWRATFQNIEMPINDYRKNLCLKEINADFLIYIFHRTHSKHVHTLSSSTRKERPQAGVSACGLININTKQRSKTCGPSTIRTVTAPRRAKRFIELASAGGAEDQRARKMRARSLPPQGGLGFSRAFFPQDRNPKDRRSEDAKCEENPSPPVIMQMYPLSKGILADAFDHHRPPRRGRSVYPAFRHASRCILFGLPSLCVRGCGPSRMRYREALRFGRSDMAPLAFRPARIAGSSSKCRFLRSRCSRTLPGRAGLHS